MEKVKNLLDEFDEFEGKHPEVDIMDLLDCFYSCQGRAANSLEEAYHHVYGNPGSECSWCQDYMKNPREEDRWSPFYDYD